MIAADINLGKLELARRMGATDVLVPDADLAAQVGALEPGGVDHAFDATGAAGVAAAAMDATRPGGTTVLVGSPVAGSTIDVRAHLLLEDRTLRGCVGGNATPSRDLPALLRLVRCGRLELEPLISERVPLDAVNEAMAASVSARSPAP